MAEDRVRRRWLFPDVQGRFEGIDLDGLDLDDEADRAILIRAEHPGYSGAARQGRGGDGGPQVDPQLHLSVHEVVTNQIWEGNPPETWQTARRLTAAGYERHKVLHMLASVVAGQVWKMQINQVPFDPDTYVAGLDALPDSWEEASAGGQSSNDLHAPDFVGHDDLVGPYDDDDDDNDDVDYLVEAAVGLLAEDGPLSAEELCGLLDAEIDDIEEVAAESWVVLLGDGRMAFVPSVLEGAVFTHRLTAEEAATGIPQFGPDWAPLMGLICGDEHLHLVDGDIVTVSGAEVEDYFSTEFSDDAGLHGPDGWLGGAAADELVGFRLVAAQSESGLRSTDGAFVDALLQMVQAPPEPVVPETLARQLVASFKRFGDGDGMPVTPLELICQLAVDAPALTAGVLAPFGEVLKNAGFEVRGGHTAPVGTDWEAFFRLRWTASVAVSHGLSADEGHLLVIVCEMCRLYGLGMLHEVDREMAGEVGEMLGNPAIADAFADVTSEGPDVRMDFLAKMRAVAPRRARAQLAWVESLIAGRAAEIDRAEVCLRAALAADPDHEDALEDSAWYASDRGDAAGALRFLERLEDDPDEGRRDLLRRYAAGATKFAGVGRNDQCPCGSGRKYKHCCLAGGSSQPDHPLPDRVRWLWDKMQWWLDRAGHESDVVVAALALRRGSRDTDEVGFLVDFDIASSLVLFADDAITEFLRERSALLPDDERNLAAQWSLSERSLHEVTEVDAGAGVTLRDVRTGDVVEVTERSASTQLAAGDLICAHPVFDGVGYQFVGGLVAIPLRLQQPLMALLDEGAGSYEVALMLAAARQPPELVNMEGEPTIMCEATYRTDDPAGAASQLDTVLEHLQDGTWAEFIEVDGRRWLRGGANLDVDVLTVTANSEERFERLRNAVTRAVAGLELLDEHRTSPAEIMEQRRRDPTFATPSAGAGMEVPPEAVEAVAAFMREQEERWIDESVPALAGLTPRQAAADPTRREDLLALLHEFDRSPTPGGAVGFDTARLRVLLGLGGA